MPELNEIISFIITCIQIFLTFSLMTRLLKIKTYWWATLLYSIIIAPLSSENHLIMLGIFVVSSFIYYFISSKRQLKLTTLSIAMHLFLSQLVASIIQLIFFAFSSFVNINFLRTLSILIYMIMLSIVKHKKFNVLNLINNKIIFSIACTMILVNFVVFSYLPLTGDQFLNVASIFSPLGATVIQIVVAYLAFSLNKFATELEVHEINILYTDTLRESLDNLSMFQHDLGSMINTMLGYCDLEMWDEIRPYLHEVISEIRYDNNISIINYEFKDNMPYLYGIVLAKSADATTNRINFSIEVNIEKFELKTVNEVQLSRMIGNLLNNAFDAAKHTDKKSVTLNISNFDKSRIKVQISNSVNIPVDIDNLLEKGYSTKENHKGLGLYQVKSIIDRQIKEGFNVKLDFYNVSKNTFVVELII